jgi:hypothetical protein
MKKKLLGVLLMVLSLVSLIGLTAIPIQAATTATITVTNTTQYLAISVSPTTYNFNATGAAHPGVLPSTTYYSNPGGQTTAPSSTVVDGECAFTATNGSSVAGDITNNMSDMTGGTDNSTNGNTGAAGATSYGSYTYISGIALASKVLLKSSASGVAISNLAAAGTKMFGIQLNEQTNAWTGATAATMTVTLTVAAH